MQYRLKVNIVGEVIVSAESAEAAELLVQYCDPHLSGTKIIRNTLETEVLGEMPDVILQPDNIAVFQNSGETTH